MTKDAKYLRLAQLQGRLREMALDCALLVNSRDIYYYTGTAQPALLLVTPKDYYLLARKEVDLLLKETWIDPTGVVTGAGLAEAHTRLQDLGIKKGQIGLELDIISADLYLRITRLLVGFDPADISGAILSQRMIKDQDEIEVIKQACQVMQAGHRRVFEVLRPGMTELELAAEIECAHRKAGHEGDYSIRMADFFMSRGPVASGRNLLQISGFGNTITGIGLSQANPAGPSHRKIKRGDLLVVDIPICYQGYHCDESRTYILGEPTSEVKTLFESLQEVVSVVLASMRPGAKGGDLFEAARERARELGIGDYLLKLNDRYSNFIGHGIGLEVNEPPLLSSKSGLELQSGMVVTVEIHLSHPAQGAMKIEQMVLITNSGYEILSLAGNELYVIHK